LDAEAFCCKFFRKKKKLIVDAITIFSVFFHSENKGAPMNISREKNGKGTAEATVFARAAGHHDPEIANPDFLAERLLNIRYKLLLSPGLRQLSLRYYEHKVPGMYLYHQARTIFLDKLFLAATRSVRQIVILGAGFDTRPYRFAERLRGLRIFEVDHPGTAEWKRQRLHRLGTYTGHVTYVKTDFNSDSLEACLYENNYDPEATTFFLWEGVTMYLPAESVIQTLSFISEAPPGSSVAFDYIYASSLVRPRDFTGAEPYYRIVAHRNEPCLFGIDPEDVGPFLNKYDLSILSNIGPRELFKLVPPRALCDFLGIVHAGRNGTGRPREFTTNADDLPSNWNE
jgi:methyltransferase (TIGR00027 family)